MTYFRKLLTAGNVNDKSKIHSDDTIKPHLILCAQKATLNRRGVPCGIPVARDKGQSLLILNFDTSN